MTRVYKFVFTPEFVFWLSVIVAACALSCALAALSDKPKEQAPRVKEWTPADSVLAMQVDEIFTRVRNIECLVTKNTGRIHNLEKK